MQERAKTQDEIIDLISCEISKDVKKKSDIMMELAFIRNETAALKKQIVNQLQEADNLMNEIREEIQNELADANDQIADILEKIEKLEDGNDASRSMNTLNQSIQSRGASNFAMRTSGNND